MRRDAEAVNGSGSDCGGGDGGRGGKCLTL